MIAVAIVASGMGAWSLGQTSLERASKAKSYATFERLWVRGDLMDSAIPTPEDFAKTTAYYQGMRLKYERAVWYPWLPAPPDPPESK
jgi:hypothetical protein